VKRALAHRLRQLADEGHLTIDDHELAALHFALLVSESTTSWLSTTADHDATGIRPEARIELAARTGVRAFLYGYAPNRTR